MADDNVVLVQATSDVVDAAVAEEGDLIEREVRDEFVILMKYWAAWVPRVKSDFNKRSGIIHLS